VTDDQVNELDWFFSETGPAAQELEGYRLRPQQLEMAHAVASAMSKQGHLVVEAGTGVGKSLGYLVPAVLEAIARGRRVLVSTHTLSLQDQLIQKDIPWLEKVLPGRFTAEVAKGRSNYVAPRRLEMAVAGAEESGADLEIKDQLRRIQFALRQPKAEGTRQEIFPAPTYDVWEQVQSEHGNCLGKACPHFDDDCAYHVARRRLQDADLIVVNHSLYLADLALRAKGAKLLPDHDVVIFDEAHTLEAVALDHFGARLTRRMVRLLLMRLHRRHRGMGFLQYVRNSGSARRLCSDVEDAADVFFDSVSQFCGGMRGDREISDENQIRDSLSPVLRDLAAELSDLKLDCGSQEQESEFQSYISRIDGMVEALQVILRPNAKEGLSVHWAESSGRGSAVSIQSKPLKANEMLKKLLFDRIGTVVLTSATLATGRHNGLEYIARSLGAVESDRLQLGSPFDYQANVRLRIPTWLNEPSKEEDYEERCANAILNYIERSQGGAFVLFTSYDFMNKIRDRIIGRLEDLGYPVFVQGEEMPRAMMVKAFQESSNSVLLGTDSFWQGVDVKGEKLRLVIIVRLPFSVPSAPLQKARARLVEAEGGNAFRDLALPEAIIRFKQGFGRLIRTETDKGTVVVLDTRIKTKFYGRAFLDAIPRLPLIED
jgi:ATP-dependent DNA helicase DinG